MAEEDVIETKNSSSDIIWPGKATQVGPRSSQKPWGITQVGIWSVTPDRDSVDQEMQKQWPTPATGAGVWRVPPLAAVQQSAVTLAHGIM